MPSTPPKVAYFSMEVGLRSDIPTYSGGLGVLAGDTLKAAADLAVPLVGVTLLYRKGYFRQELDDAGHQGEHPVEWEPADKLERLEQTAQVEIEGRPVRIAIWRYAVEGRFGHVVPVFFLDCDLPENDEKDRRLTDQLYGGEERYRLAQETVLGIGGVRALRALGLDAIEHYHMNEGHSALLTLALLAEHDGSLTSIGEAEIDRVRQHCVFTTHTPVPAGHDKFSLGLVEEVLGPTLSGALRALGMGVETELNMTHLALYFSRYINGVAMKHGEVSQTMFPNYPINSITNGIHVPTWASEPFQQLFDEHIPEWRSDSLYLRYAVRIPIEDILSTHQACKQQLLAEIQRRTGHTWADDVFTIGFARRATPYKRADLLFQHVDRLRNIAETAGRIQIVYAGKAHPRDEGGKALIRRIYEAREALGDGVSIVYLQNYDMDLGRLLCAGVDVWLNTPEKPREASGTSGMKAALNGVPSFSVLDGWWIEGHFENVTGWSIGDSAEGASDREAESATLYDKLEHVVLPLYYREGQGYGHIRRNAIALNASFFNTQRMVAQYVRNAYRMA